METLGDQPVVVAQGRQMKNFVPLAVFLRRNPNLAAIQTAITETVTSGTGLASITPKTNRVIRTEPVAMSDGQIHAVHVWCGPPDEEPPERPIPGPLKWDVTLGEGTRHGRIPRQRRDGRRNRADDRPRPRGGHAQPQPQSRRGQGAVAGNRRRTRPDLLHHLGIHRQAGDFRRVGLCARTAMETVEDGTEHLIARAMNLVEEVGVPPPPGANLAQRILERAGPARGVPGDRSI